MSAELSVDDEEALRPPWEVGRVVGDRYRLTRILGYGGVGAVYAAEQLDLGREVAIKALRGRGTQVRRASARLMREARTVARLSHPNIVDVFDVGVEGDVPYLVMELLRGESLGERLSRGRMSIPEAGKVLLPAMRGVAAAHAAGVIHRDLKPDNLFLCLREDGALSRVLVLDFGISVDAQRELLDTRLTRSGTIVGTPRYMAPEQLAGEPVDARADVYAFGAILYEMITGQAPVDGDTFALLAAAKLSSRPEPPSVHLPTLGVRLESLILRSLDRDPARRPESVESFAEQLTDALVDPGPVSRPKSAPRRRWLGVGALIAALTLGGVGGALAWWLTKPGESPAPVRTQQAGAEEPATVTPPAPDPPPTAPLPQVDPLPDPQAPPEVAAEEPEAPAQGPSASETEEEPSPTISRRGARPPGVRTRRLTWDDF